MNRYQRYIQSPAWFVRKEAFLEKHGRSCGDCGRDAKNLHVHHLSYKRLRNEADEDLIALCAACHRERHDITVAPRRKTPRAFRDWELNPRRGYGNI